MGSGVPGGVGSTLGADTGPNVGMCCDRTFPPAFVTEVAEHLDRHGVDRLWVIEDCFFTAGISLAAAVARTERLRVGLGILPAVARNPAITAMELATLAGLAPDRVVAGIGHGVQDWMEQMGARSASPLTTPEEVITVVRALLAGERVSFHGHHVILTDVALEQPPSSPPPVLGNPALDDHPMIDELRARHHERGVDGLADLPAAAWHELGAIGNFDDAVAHVEALHDAGADDVSLFPAPEVDVAYEQLEQVVRLAAAVCHRIS